MATAKRPDDLTDAEILALMRAEKAAIAQARENLRKYGSTLAPDEATLEISPVAPPRANEAAAQQYGLKYTLKPRPPGVEPDPSWVGVTKVCPHCKKEKDVLSGFGIVRRNGLQHAAGWCRVCRSSTNYHAKPASERRPKKPSKAKR